jgi:hypothetical protein
MGSTSSTVPLVLVEKKSRAPGTLEKFRIEDVNEDVTGKYAEHLKEDIEYRRDPIEISYSCLGLCPCLLPSIAQQDSERTGAVKSAPGFGAVSSERLTARTALKESSRREGPTNYPTLFTHTYC